MENNLLFYGLKECSACTIFLPLKKFRTRIQHGKPYIVARCRKCEQEFNKIQQDPEKRRLAERKRFAIPEKRENKNQYQTAWRKKNISKNRAYHRKNIKKNVDEMSDLYIGRIIFHKKIGIPIPHDLIKLKRLQLIAKRTLKIKTK